MGTIVGPMRCACCPNMKCCDSIVIVSFVFPVCLAKTSVQLPFVGCPAAAGLLCTCPTPVSSSIAVLHCALALRFPCTQGTIHNHENLNPPEHAQAPQGALGRIKQQLSSLWGPSSTQQQQQGSPSLATSAFTTLKATAARWLAKKAEDPESREALLAFGSSSLLDFLVSTATEETTSPEQQHAEQAVVSAVAAQRFAVLHVFMLVRMQHVVLSASFNAYHHSVCAC